MLRDCFPDVMLIQNEYNVGLGRASNQGIVATRGRHVLLLNNDTVIDQASIDEFVRFLDVNPTAGAVGGRLLNEDGSFQAGYAQFSTLTEEFLIATRVGELLWDGYPSHHDAKEATCAGWLSSACLLVRRAALNDVGTLDEEYFIYGDEADLQFRLQRAGWGVFYLPTAETLHYGGRSMNRWHRRKMVYRAKLLFYAKHYGNVRTLALRVMLGSLSTLKLLVWAAAYCVPSRRVSAGREVDSNWEVAKLCLRLE
jgi:hypothetical protein